MNGAEHLVTELADAGVEVCFANPGTSEMHFVAALDKISSIRCILCLAEGIVTGAADGYARMSGKPGVTLLHLGPGLGNGLSNLHNARKARSSILNIVGDHATYHLEYDAPLTADIEGVAKPVSHWIQRCESADNIAATALAALQQADTYPGHIATLILPADTAWTEVSPSGTGSTMQDALVIKHDLYQKATIPTSLEHRAAAAARALQSGSNSALLMTGSCLSERGLQAAGKIRKSTGASLLAQTANGRLARGAGRVSVTAVPYPVDDALSFLAPYDQIITACAKSPVAFFAYPGKPSSLIQESAVHTVLAGETDDGIAALEALADELGASDLVPDLQAAEQHPVEEGAPLNADTIGQVVARAIPDQAIVVDEAITMGRNFQKVTRGSRPHDWLQICGGAIGDGFPLATGAAIACPQRKVIALQADGSGMYSLQALWTQARENLDITTLVFSNRSYAILKHELKNVGATAGKTADDLMDLDRPALDWVALANGMGVEAVQVTNTSELEQQMQIGLDRSGPFLIELLI